MRILSLVLFSFFMSTSIYAQDAYHQSLNSWLMNNYGLPTAEWIIDNTEVNIYNSAINYGCTESVEDVTDQDFSKVSQVVVGQAGNNPWDAGWKADNSIAVQDGDNVLLVLWLRSIGGSGKTNIFIERASNFDKEAYLAVSVQEEWTQYLIPFDANGDYSVGQLTMGFHLALQAQTLQIGGFTAINYGNAVDLDDLPSDLNNDQYGGFQEDAPWRTPAAERIDQLRKANLTIVAETTTGTPISDAGFEIEMTQHEFAFGSAITAARIAGNDGQNNFYENKLTNLDGEGHGFNWVVFENDMKWDGWEEEWFVDHNELVNAVSWLADRDIKIRGHNLVWPGWEFLPDDIQPNAGNHEYIWNRIDGRLDEILNYPGFEAEKIPEWDVLNEIVVNSVLEPTFANAPGNTTGRELYADIFTRAKELSPNTKMYINDYVTMTLGNTGGGQYDILKARIQELLDAGAPIEGVGFQAHIGGFPNAIPDILGTLDDFYNDFGLTAKITEFDMPPIISEELGATYLGDFMTAVFSHESVDGFLFWNFWDGATWQNPGTNLFRLDWSRTPAGDRFNELVFNDWWTDTTRSTDESGSLTQRGFKGTYNITYTCDGQTVTETLSLTEDMTLTIECDDIASITTSVADLEKTNLDFSISPNPASQFLKIQREDSERAKVILYNSIGVKVLEQEIFGSVSDLNVEHLTGIFILELRNESGRGYQKVVIE